MDINIFISGVGAGAGVGTVWFLFRRALRAKRSDNGSKPDHDSWLADLRRRVTELESEKATATRIAIEFEDRLIRMEEDVSALERDVRVIRTERKQRRI